MPWGRLDDQLHMNPKVWSFGDKAFRVWIYSIALCNRKRRADPEGHVTRDMAVTVTHLCDASVDVIDELIAKGGWDADDGGGYRVHDFDQYGPRFDRTAADRKRRQRDRERDVTPPVTPPVTRDVTRDTDVTSRNGHTPPVPVPITTSTRTYPSDKQEEIVQDSLSVADSSATERENPPSRREMLRTRRALVAALDAVERFGAPANRVEAKQRRDAVDALLESAPPVTPDELPLLVARWDQEHDPGLLTPLALARHLGRLRRPGASRRPSAPRSHGRPRADPLPAPVPGDHFVPGAWDAPPDGSAPYGWREHDPLEPLSEEARDAAHHDRDAAPVSARWLDALRRDGVLTLEDVRASGGSAS